MATTLLIGTRCADGVVIASDKWELCDFEVSDQCDIKKADFQADGTRTSLMIAGTSLAPFWERIAQWLFQQDALKPDRPHSLSELMDGAAGLSLGMSVKYPKSSNFDEPMGCIVAGLEHLYSGRAQLYYLGESGLNPTALACLGTASAGALPLADLLLRRPDITTTQACSILPVIFLIVRRLNFSAGEGPSMYIMADDQEAIAFPKDLTRQATRKAITLLQEAPDYVLQYLHGPEYLVSKVER